MMTLKYDNMSVLVTFNIPITKIWEEIILDLI